MYIIILLEIFVVFIVYYFKIIDIMLVLCLYYILQYIIIYDYCKEINCNYIQGIVSNLAYVCIIIFLVLQVYKKGNYYKMNYYKNK